jgi:hypothetical protein
MGLTSILSNRNPDLLGRLWRDLPGMRNELRPYFEKAKSYRNECGCAMGGGFLIAAIAVVLLHRIAFHPSRGGHLLMSILQEIAFVFVACILGKAIGIGIARIRLSLLYRKIRIRYQTEGV